MKIDVLWLETLLLVVEANSSCFEVTGDVEKVRCCHRLLSAGYSAIDRGRYAYEASGFKSRVS
jgi:hypothetical protein